MHRIHRVWSTASTLLAVTTCFAIVASVGCGEKDKAGTSPVGDKKSAGSAEDVKVILMEMLEPDVNPLAVMVKMRPTHDDYQAVFDDEFAAKVETSHERQWESLKEAAKEKPTKSAAEEGVVDVKIYSASIDDLKNGSNDATKFPPGYKAMADKFKDGVRIYGAEFINADGQPKGQFIEAIVFVNGNWRMFPEVYGENTAEDSPPIVEVQTAEVAPVKTNDPTNGAAPPTAPEGSAKAIVEQFVQPGADHAALSKALRPTHEDYFAVFEPELAAKIEAMHAPAWEAGEAVIKPRDGQTEIEFFETTTDDIRAWTPQAEEHFPGGYGRIKEHFNPGFKICRFEFVEPGKTDGIAFDGLIYVNGRWVLIPQPFEAQKPE